MIRLPAPFGGTLTPEELARFDAALGLPPAELARAALAGDPFARVAERMSVKERWFEVTGNAEDPPPREALAAEARKQRRRRRRRRR